MAEKVKVWKYLRLMKNLISCKTISQITTFLKNLKLGQTVHELISSLMCIVTLKHNGLNYIALSKHRINEKSVNKQCLLATPPPPHSASVTLKMRSRSLKSNHFFPLSQWSICASLVKFHLLIHEIECTQGSF